jgi:RimJ/RimL family protein N-acetyltransferase
VDETARLTIEPLTVAHADEMFDASSAPELHRYTSGAPPASLEALRARHARLVAGSPDPRERWLNWALRERATGAIVGYLQATVRGDVADAAWVIFVPAQRRGLAREAVTWLLGALPVARVEATIDVENVASLALARGLGFTVVETRDTPGEGSGREHRLARVMLTAGDRHDDHA